MGNNDKIKIVVIAGPTASGKSSLAIKVASKYNSEIISADSRQIYKQLNIGTDRLNEKDMLEIPHHLMGEYNLGDRFTAFDFINESERVVYQASEKGKNIIICGGTGLYIRALTDGIVELPDEKMSYRNELLDLAAEKGPKFIHNMLMDVDPEEALKVHYNNMIKVIRALEIYNLTGRPKSEILKDTEPRSKKFNFLQIVLKPDRDKLYKLIEQRVDQMFEIGLLEEAESVYRSEYKKALKECKVVGYSELIEYFEDKISLDEAISKIKQNTRRYAKRQYTWFNNIAGAKTIAEFGNNAFEKCDKLVASYWYPDKIKKT